MPPKQADGPLPIPDSADHPICDRDFGLVAPQLLDDVRRSGRCLRCGHGVAQHAHVQFHAAAAAAPQVVVMHGSHQDEGPLAVDYLPFFRPNDVPAPLISPDSHDTGAQNLAASLHHKSSIQRAPEWVRAIWFPIEADTVGAIALVFARCVELAPRPAGQEISQRVSQLIFNYVNIPPGRSELEIGSFFHRHGVSLLSWIAAEAAMQAKAGVGSWREVMVPQRDPMMSGGEDVIRRIMQAGCGLTTIPASVLRGNNPRNPSFWACLWSKLLTTDRLSRFKEIAFRIVIGLALTDKRNGYYLARNEYQSRFFASGHGGHGGRGGGQQHTFSGGGHQQHVAAAGNLGTGPAPAGPAQPSASAGNVNSGSGGGGWRGGGGRRSGGRGRFGRGGNNSQQNSGYGGHGAAGSVAGCAPHSYLSVPTSKPRVCEHQVSVLSPSSPSANALELVAALNVPTLRFPLSPRAPGRDPEDLATEQMRVAIVPFDILLDFHRNEPTVDALSDVHRNEPIVVPHSVSSNLNAPGRVPEDLAGGQVRYAPGRPPVDNPPEGSIHCASEDLASGQVRFVPGRPPVDTHSDEQFTCSSEEPVAPASPRGLVAPLAPSHRASGVASVAPTALTQSAQRGASVAPTAHSLSSAAMFGSLVASTAPPLSTPKASPGPGGCGTPDADWEYVSLPRAASLGASICHAPFQQLNMGRSLDALERIVSTSGSTDLLPHIDGEARRRISEAVGHARSMLDSDGRISIRPRALVPVDSRVLDKHRSSPDAERLLDVLMGSPGVTLVLSSEGRWFHRLFCVPKPDGQGGRLISDLRLVNALFDSPPTFAHPTVESLFRGSHRYGTKLDLKRAFYQPLITDALSRCFSFQLGEDGTAAYTGLPMGWSWSPVVFDIMLRPLDLLLRSLTLSVVRYVDDIAVLADTPEALASALETIFWIAREMGWCIAPDKTFLVAARVFVFLGVRVDLGSASVRWAAAKRAKVQAACEYIANCDRRGQPVQRDTLAALAGRLSFLMACFPLGRVFLRPLWDSLTADSRPHVPCTPALRAVASFWLSGEGLQVAERWWPVAGARERPTWRAATDASSLGVGWSRVTPPNGQDLPGCSWPLSKADASRGSAVRETVALTALLQFLRDPRRPGPPVAAGDLVEVRLDAAVVVFAGSRGTARAADLVAEMRQTARELLALPPVALRLVWTPRSENVEADDASRDVSLADSALLSSTFDRLRAIAGFRPSVDLFASPANAVASRFWSRHPTVLAEGVDGLSAPVLPAAYAFPPFALARLFTAIARKYSISRTPLIAILPADVVRVELPDWQHVVVPVSEPSIVPPPYTLPAVPSPRPLSAIIIPSPPQRL